MRDDTLRSYKIIKKECRLIRTTTLSEFAEKHCDYARDIIHMENISEPMRRFLAGKLMCALIEGGFLCGENRVFSYKESKRYNPIFEGRWYKR